MRAWLASGLGLGQRLPGVARTAGWWRRWLGFVYFAALLSISFEIRGLIGPEGILPAGDLFQAVRTGLGPWQRFARLPSLLWLGTSAGFELALALAGLAAAVVVMTAPSSGRFSGWVVRAALAVCLACFLSFIAAAQVFASYQSDGMLMTAGLIALFLDERAPSWWSWFSLRWLWFSIYFGSGIAKMLSGDPEWRHLTALDHYYENGPLPSMLGWFAQQHFPHGLEAAIALATLVLELGLAWLCFGPRRARIALFWITTPFQLAIIATSNYGFLNWLVLGLGLALLDDRHLNWILAKLRLLRLASASAAGPARPAAERAGWATAAASLLLAALFALTAANLAQRIWPRFPAPARLSAALEPWRIADPFGLFAVMTRARYEIEFQGTEDGEHWTAYPFRFKPQDPAEAPGWFGPYQPRFDWNLWFASLANYQDNPWVEQVELRLLDNDRAVTGLFRSNPFAAHAPRAVRAVVWQYWFATPAERRAQGVWWTRKLLGLYCPPLAMTPSGPVVVQ